MQQLTVCSRRNPAPKLQHLAGNRYRQSILRDPRTCQMRMRGSDALLRSATRSIPFRSTYSSNRPLAAVAKPFSHGKQLMSPVVLLNEPGAHSDERPFWQNLFRQHGWKCNTQKQRGENSRAHGAERVVGSLRGFAASWCAEMAGRHRERGVGAARTEDRGASAFELLQRCRTRT